MHPAGFSTGALALGDFRSALRLMDGHDVTAVELSALRVSELEPLVDAVPDLDLSRYRHVSVHGPSKFSAAEEAGIVSRLSEFSARGWPIILHPDSVHDWRLWNPLGELLFVENMDKRKLIGRTVEELSWIFDQVPQARLCFDIAHARQFDVTMTEAYRILAAFGTRVGEVHISEVNTQSRHDRISLQALRAFQEVADLLSGEVPVIIESQVPPEGMGQELSRALEVFAPRIVSVSV